MFYIANVLFLK
uniref:Uncharacterized protein n=1 Tax=Anguilla anguilla TaxID=7936 RepID=A0A0E9R260_ANGAN